MHINTLESLLKKFFVIFAIDYEYGQTPKDKYLNDIPIFTRVKMFRSTTLPIFIAYTFNIGAMLA